MTNKMFLVLSYVKLQILCFMFSFFYGKIKLFKLNSSILAYV